MEPTQLQLVLNIVSITGVTSLAGFCYLLKKENRKLATAREATPPVAKAPAVEKAAVPASEPDIRQFAAGRRTGWVQGLASALSHDER